MKICKLIFETIRYKTKLLFVAAALLTMVFGAGGTTVYGNTAATGSNDTYTLLIYMNGSDLESKYKLATQNINGMLSAQIASDKFKVMIMTGGTSEWHTDEIKNDMVTYLRLDKNGLEAVKYLPGQSIGLPDTLSDFISFSMQAEPSDRYGIIFWNHGAGSVRGFGVDELYDRDSLTVSEIREGLSDGLKGERFNFIGFDACLMATAEVADACASFADFMIASQELEPGEGWDYKTILSEFDKEPGMDTLSMGKIIVNSFIERSAEINPIYQTTLSLIDLSKISLLSDALGNIAEKISGEVTIENFSQVSQARNNTKAFGSPNMNNTGMDMVDIIDLADKVAEMFPDESLQLKEAVEGAVAYSRTSDNIENANGLSVYFPYKNKRQLNSLESYYSSGFNEEYLKMVSLVAENLTSGKSGLSTVVIGSEEEQSVSMLLNSSVISDVVEIYAVLLQDTDEGFKMFGLDSDIEIDETTGKINANFNRDWVSLNGINVAVYAIEHNEEIIVYSVPVLLNGEEAELIVIYDDENPYGLVAGARKISDVPDKGTIPINDGDEIIFLYEVFDMESKTETGGKLEGSSIIYDGEIVVDVTPVPDGKYLYGFCMLDIYQNRLYSKFIELEF